MHVFGESDDRVVPEQPTNHSEGFWSLWERVSAAMADITDGAEGLICVIGDTKARERAYRLTIGKTFVAVLWRLH